MGQVGRQKTGGTDVSRRGIGRNALRANAILSVLRSTSAKSCTTSATGMGTWAGPCGDNAERHAVSHLPRSPSDMDNNSAVLAYEVVSKKTTPRRLGRRKKMAALS